MGRWNGCDLDPCVSMGSNTQARIGEAMAYDDYDDDGTWLEVLMLPFALAACVVRILFVPTCWVVGFALGLCLAPFIILMMALKIFAVGAILAAFCRPRSC